MKLHTCVSIKLETGKIQEREPRNFFLSNCARVSRVKGFRDGGLRFPRIVAVDRLNYSAELIRI